MDNVTTVGIDLAKDTFSLHGVDALGCVVLQQSVKRRELLSVVRQLPPCLIGLETGSGAHQWAREFQAMGHCVKLMSPQFVAPYRLGSKNDGNDAVAICEAVQRPRMRFVPVKSLEQQSWLSLHRVHLGFIEERTAMCNRIRGLLAEFGFVLARKSATLRRVVPTLLESVPSHVARCLRDLLDHVRLLDERVAEYTREIVHHAKTHPGAKLIQERLGLHCLFGRRIRVPQRPASCRLARDGAQAALDRRQSALRTNHPTRRQVFAHAAGAGSEICFATSAEARRCLFKVGTASPTTSRLSPCVCGDCRQECARRLGDVAGPATATGICRLTDNHPINHRGVQSYCGH